MPGTPPHPAPLCSPCRWDQLLKAAWARQSALSGSVAPMPPLHAVGATLNIDRLVHVAQASSRWRHPGSSPVGAWAARGAEQGTRPMALHTRPTWAQDRTAQVQAACLQSRLHQTRPPPPALPSRHRMPPPSGPAPPPAVAGLPRLSQADVLVCARGGGGLLKERMALARTLWEAGIAAELLPQTAPSLTDQYEYAQSRGIPWLVIIHASTFGGEVAWRGQCQGWAGDWSLPLEGDGLKLPGIPLLVLPIFAFRVLVIHWKQTVPAQRPFSCCGWAGMREGPSAHFAFP